MLRRVILALLAILAPPLAHGQSQDTPTFSRPSLIGAGSTGDVSGMRVTPTGPNGWTVGRTLADKSADAISLRDFGAKGDGTTNDDTAWRHALSAVAGGGKLRIPCGIYVLTPFSFNVLAYKELIIEGSGSCSELYFPGLSSGAAITINLNQQFAAFHLRDFHITTDTPSDSTFGIAAYGPSGNLAAVGALNDISNVVLRAHAGQYQAAYFGIGVYLKLVNNVIFDRFQYWGASGDGSSGSPYHGTAAKFEGAATGCKQSNGKVTTNFCYAVGYRFVDSHLAQCAICVVYGDYAQGVSLVNTDIIGSYVGIQVPSGQTANDVLSFANGEIYATQQGILNQSAKSFSFVNASCQVIAVNSICLYIGAAGGSSVIGSHFNGADTGTGTPVAGSTGIFIASSAKDVVITGNTYNFLAQGNFVQRGATNINVQSNSYASITRPNTPSATSGTVVIGGGSP